jgi:hypothetical protein
MDADELQTYLEDYLAAKDAVPAKPTLENEGEHTVESEGFVSSRG